MGYSEGRSSKLNDSIILHREIYRLLTLRNFAIILSTVHVLGNRVSDHIRFRIEFYDFFHLVTCKVRFYPFLFIFS